MTHQDLLDAWVDAELVVIGEYSGNMVRDWQELVRKAETYAAEHGLNTEVLDDTRELIRESTEYD